MNNDHDQIMETLTEKGKMLYERKLVELSATYALADVMAGSLMHLRDIMNDLAHIKNVYSREG